MPKSLAGNASGGNVELRAGKPASAASGHARNQPALTISVVRDAVTGRFRVGGTDERRLINRHSRISVKPAPGKPKYFTAAEIQTLTKLMKVA